MLAISVLITPPSRTSFSILVPVNNHNHHVVTLHHYGLPPHELEQQLLARILSVVRIELRYLASKDTARWLVLCRLPPGGISLLVLPYLAL
jgi:hypothetical protein